MEREIDLEAISDGRLYTADDLVKIGCNDCSGCSSCCRTVSDTILLDPYDGKELCLATGLHFDGLMTSGHIELSVVEGVILPHLHLKSNQAGCTFLSEAGRCLIHDHRPGFCRMFPMGRLYEDGSFRYFLQVSECPYPHKSKVKLKKWLNIPQLASYERFVSNWHFFIKDVGRRLMQEENPAVSKQQNLFLLQHFYRTPYTGSDFYAEYTARVEAARAALLR